jgi:DNA-binding NarL/FixJ family response regulator
MDLSMPELNGLQATERLKAERPEMKVVALTAHEDESYLRQLC